MNKTDEIVQYFVVNQEVKMSAPKLGVQIGHVATMITYDMFKKDILEKCTMDYYQKLDTWNKWYENGKNQKKIILRGKEKDLLKLIDQGFYYIRDNGLTECEPNSLTVVGLPPMYKSEAQKYIKRLQLY